jgi:molybdopterin synthase sulfur carrier subunit
MAVILRRWLRIADFLFRFTDADFRIPGIMRNMATVTVRYFAAAAEAAGREQEQLEFGPDATVLTLRELLLERYGAAMERVLRSGSFLVDGIVRRSPSTPLGASVDVLPPFAGG